jgi:hypothetical protein
LRFRYRMIRTDGGYGSRTSSSGGPQPHPRQPYDHHPATGLAPVAPSASASGCRSILWVLGGASPEWALWSVALEFAARIQSPPPPTPMGPDAMRSGGMGFWAPMGVTGDFTVRLPGTDPGRNGDVTGG